MLQMSIPFFVYKSVKKQKMRIVFSSGKQKTPLPVSDSETIAGELKILVGTEIKHAQGITFFHQTI